MPTEAATELDQALARVPGLVRELDEAITKVQAGGNYLESRFFLLQILEGIKQGMREEQSPFMNRAAAAARYFCSEGEIDRAAKAGILTPLLRGTGPLFEKAQGDAAVRSGAWTPKQNGKRKAESQNLNVEAGKQLQAA